MPDERPVTREDITEIKRDLKDLDHKFDDLTREHHRQFQPRIYGWRAQCGILWHILESDWK